MSEIDFDALPFESLVFFAQRSAAQRETAIRDGLCAASYTAWQLGAGKGKAFGEYLRDLGLRKTEPRMSMKAKKAIAERAHSIAERIMAMDRKRVDK